VVRQSEIHTMTNCHLRYINILLINSNDLPRHYPHQLWGKSPYCTTCLGVRTLGQSRDKDHTKRR
jgi:hypothetical protein